MLTEVENLYFAITILTILCVGFTVYTYYTAQYIKALEDYREFANGRMQELTLLAREALEIAKRGNARNNGAKADIAEPERY